MSDVLVMGMHYAPESTGNAPYTTGMVAALHAAGHRVRVITGYPHYPQWRVFDGFAGLRREEDDHGVPVVRVRHPVPASPSAVSRIVMDAVFALHTATVRIPAPDVVVAVSPVLLTVAAALARRRPGRTALGVVTQDLYGRALVETGLAPPGAARLGGALERALLTRADGVAAVHETFARSLVSLGVAAERVTVIRNWSHIDPARDQRDAIRARLGWGDETIVLHAGNMGLKQGLRNVVEAARCADGVGAPVRFVLLGDGGQRRALEAAAHGVERLSFVDPLPGEDFPDALAAADVLLLNEAETVAEMSVPSKLTSYFTSGRPVVAATHAHSAAGVEIESSGAGVRVEPGDPPALLRAVLDLAGDPARAMSLGERGTSYARRRLGRVAAAEAYCAWVEGLAQGRTSRHEAERSWTRRHEAERSWTPRTTR